MATPAARKSSDLKAACVTRCAPAGARLICDCVAATTPPAIAVTIPTTATAGPNQLTDSNDGASRTRMYAPAATIVAECSSADTGVGPAIAEKSHGEKGT